MPRQSVRSQRLSLLTFGMGFLAGLTRRGVSVLSVSSEADIHQGVVEAFKVVEAELGAEKLSFWMTTHPGWGTSPDVYAIFRHYMACGYATLDMPDRTPFRFSMSREEADQRLEDVEGGAELYDKAVAAFLDYINSHYSL